MVSHSRTPQGAHRLRVLNEPQAIIVRSNQLGQPTVVQLDGRWTRVASIQDRWRIDEEWWRQEITRLYYLMLLEDGRQITVFQDFMSRKWYRQPYA